VSTTGTVAEVLAAIAATLDGLGATWYVFGAQAVVAYGSPRLTADVDVTAMLPLERVDEALASFARVGLEPRIPLDAAFVRRTRVVPLVHRASRLGVDLVLAGRGLEERFLAGAREMDLAGVRVRVIGPEDLIVSKVLAGRGKDHDDVVGVLRAQGAALDLARCRETLAELEAALDRSDLLPTLDDLVRRAGIS
jgi:hypothetical protein